MKDVGEAEIAAVRRFNRFYTRELGILRKTFFDTPWTLGEVRVIYEIRNGTLLARDIARALNVDQAYLSRLIGKLEKEGLVARKASALDGRQYELSLTARGRAAFDRADERQRAQTAGVLARMPTVARKELTAAMARIEALMCAYAEEAA